MLRIGLLGVAFLALLVTVNAECTDDQVMHCTSCSNPGIECVDCPKKTVLQEDKQGCENCPLFCAECERESDEMKCLRCDERYALRDSDTACLPCSTGCKTCNHTAGDVTSCIECFSSFTMMTSQAMCLSCPSNCAKCSEGQDGAAICSQCDDTYYRKTDGSCKKCPSYCTKCTANVEEKGACSECIEGYVVNDADPTSSCLRCPSQCDSCSKEARSGNDAKCTSCKAAYGLNVDECESCDSDCVKCEDKDTCSECKEGFRVEDGSCEDCGKYCDKCEVDDDDKEECSLCDLGYTPITGGPTCDLCSASNCKVCNLDSGRCTTCDDGYTENDGGCEECPEHYTTGCGWNSVLDSTTCTGCKEGYGLSLDQTECKDCPDNCKTCNATAQTCSACKPRYGSDSNGDCIDCPNNCLDCDYDTGLSAMNCTANNCDKGFFLDIAGGSSGNDVCSPCADSNCASCYNGTTDCLACKENYGLKDDNTCKKCTSCKHCTFDSGDKETCTTNMCHDGYVRNNDGVCKRCPSDCDECDWKKVGDDYQSVCTDCSAKFYLNSDDTCVECPEHCTKCKEVDGTKKCESDAFCESGYGLSTDETACNECPANCKNCDENNGVMECRDCKDHYAKNGGVCGTCPPNCEQCKYDSGSITCEKCKKGYTLSNEQCVRCPSNCDECAVIGDSVQCNEKKCFGGYGRNSAKTCSACSSMFPNCAKCSDTTGPDDFGVDKTDCYSCNPGYTLADDATSCLATPVGQCSRYEDRKYVCSSGSCDEGYKEMNNGSCSSTCYSCGSTRNALFLPRLTCDIGDNVNFTTEVCLSDCWVVEEKLDTDDEYTTSRGCHISDEDVNELSKGGTMVNCEDFEGGTCREVERNGVKKTRCWKCCQGNKCNDELAGSSAIEACAALLFAAILALRM